MRNFTLNKCFITTIVALLFCSVLQAVSFEVDGICYEEVVSKVQPPYLARVISKSNGKYSGDVIIPPTVNYYRNYSVTSIDDKAFYGCTDLTSVEIPNSVTSIGKMAFVGCTSLTSIIVDNDNKVYDSRGGCNAIIETSSNSLIVGCPTTIIPNSVTSIGGNAFMGCKGLTSIEIPNGVASIWSGAFSGCTGLTSIEIPNSVKYIWDRAFSSCTGLISIEMSRSVTLIGKRAFYGCTGLTSIEIPSSVTSIDISVFSGCTGLTSIEMLSNATTIGDSTFYGCNSLTSIEIPNCVTAIGKFAFSGCTSLTSIEIPNSVTSIGNYAFSYCSGLKSIEIPNSVTSIGNYAFFFNSIKSVKWNSNTCISSISKLFGKQLLEFEFGSDIKTIPDGCLSGISSLNSVIIKGSVTSIGKRAFYGCTGLTSIEIPNSVTSIGVSAFSGCTGLTSIEMLSSATTICDSTFYRCMGLTSIEIPNSVTSIGNYAFSGCTGLTSITIPNSVTSIGESAFSGCSGLTSIEMPNSIISIGNYTFSGCSGLTSIEISNGVRVISKGAFWGCNSLTSIEIPNSVTYIAEEAFRGCTGLASIEIPQSVTLIKKNAFYGCTGLTSIIVDKDNKVYDSRGGCNAIFETATNSLICGCPATIIPNNVTIIGDYAFCGCMGLTSIEIPNSVTSIGNYAFSGCTDLISIKIPSSVTSIGIYVFSYCSGLKSIKIPSSVTMISGDAFYECTGLTSIEIPNSVTSIGVSAFSGCTGLTSMEIPNSVTMIGGYAFYGCTGLTSIEIPSSVTSIGNFAFYGCTGLTSIEIPNSVTSIGMSTFNNCTGLTSVYWNARACSISDVGSSQWPLFRFCNNIRNFTFGENVRTVPPYCCWGMSLLTSLEIPNSVTSIGNYAFSGCKGLTSMELPNSVTSIGKETFKNCTGLISIEIPISVSSVGDNAFQSCKNLSVVKWDAQNCKKVNSSIFNDCNIKEFIFGEVFNTIPSLYLENVTNIVSIDIPNTVTSVASDAFKGCADLKEIITHTGMQIFEDGALNGCTGINLVFAEDVTNIEGNSCKNIEEISSVYIPHTVSKVGGYAFSNCKGLKNITCMSVTPPSTRFDVCTASEYENVILYVPCSSVEAYENDEHWGKFVQIRCVEAETVSGTVTTTTVTPSYNSASITWPAVPSASSYNISITINGNEYCTMVFNSNGQLVSVDFNEMPGGRSGQLRAAAQVGGYKFNVSGLSEGTEYGYVVVAQNSAGGEISRNTGTFRTLGIVEVEETLENDAKTLQDKVSVSGKLISVNDENYSDMKIYNTVGQQVGNPVPVSGVYIVTAADDKIKVLVR